MSSEIIPPYEAGPRAGDPPYLDDPAAAAVRGAKLPMVVTAGQDRDYAILFANDAFTALTGYPREEVVGRNPRFLQGSGTDPKARLQMREALSAGREAGVEVLNYRKDGSTFWNGMFMSPVRNAEGAVLWFGSLLDITPRKEREHQLRRTNSDLEARVRERTEHLLAEAEQKTLLLHEVEHRVKNNLQLIASLLQFQARRTKDPAVIAALGTVQERVAAVSTAHRRLFHTSDAGRFDVGLLLRDLVEDLIGRTRRDGMAVSFDLDPVQGPANEAAALGLLVNEVLGPAVRVGPAAGGAGRLEVTLRREGGGFRIEMTDDAVISPAAVRDASSVPAGIVPVLKRQLNAAVEWRDNQQSVSALIHVPRGVT
jgi:PAS domain S-box-containing protein